MNIKSRKLFAVLIIEATVIFLLPMTNFAASTNIIDKVPQVASDYTFVLYNSDKREITIAR